MPADYIRTPDAGTDRSIIDAHLKASHSFCAPVGNDVGGNIAKDADGYLRVNTAGKLESYTTADGWIDYVTSDTLGDYQLLSEKNQANGYVGLDGSGKIEAAYLPSYVDDVVEVANYAALPVSGETGKIYVTIDTNRTYRWTGSIYVEIVASPGAVLTFGTYLQAGGSAYNGSANVTISTNATAVNTASTLVARDASGNFAAGTITATLTGNADTATAWVNSRSISATGDAAWTVSINGTSNQSAAITFATVNGNVGSFGSATQVPAYTVNGKGLITAAANVTITPAVGSITGLGTGVATALGVNVGSAGAFITYNGNAGTPSALVGTNISGTASALSIGGNAATVTNGLYTTTSQSKAGSLTLNGTGAGYLNTNPAYLFLDAQAAASESGILFSDRGTMKWILYKTGTGQDLSLFNGTANNNALTFTAATSAATFISSVTASSFIGNASTATSAATLTTTRTIWGQNFNGSANVNGVFAMGYTYAGGVIALDIQDQSGYGLYLSAQNTLNFSKGLDSDQFGYINYFGYNNGTTRFRSLVIADGKNNEIARFDGSTKFVSIATSAAPYSVLHVGAVAASDNSITISSSGSFQHAYFGKGATTFGIGVSSSNGSLVKQEYLTFVNSTGVATFVNSGNAHLILNSTNVSGGYIQFQKSGTDYGYIGDAANVTGSNGGDLAIRAQSSLRFLSNGNVAAVTIGTTQITTFASTVPQVANFGSTNSTCYTQWSTGSTTARGYIGSGSVLITGATASDFAIRAEGELFFTAGGDHCYGKILTSGWTKFTNDGTYLGGSAGTYHEFNSDKGDGSMIMYLRNKHASSPYGLEIRYSAAAPNNTSSEFFVCRDSSTIRMLVQSNGNIQNVNNSYGATSDERLKENIEDASPKLEKAMQIRLRSYNRLGDKLKQLGVVSQEIEPIFPGLVEEQIHEDGLPAKSVKYSIIPLITLKAFQEYVIESRAAIADLKAEIKELRG